MPDLADRTDLTDRSLVAIGVCVAGFGDLLLVGRAILSAWRGVT
jgi:hypothetical protein